MVRRTALRDQGALKNVRLYKSSTPGASTPTQTLHAGRPSQSGAGTESVDGFCKVSPAAMPLVRTRTGPLRVT